MSAGTEILAELRQDRTAELTAGFVILLALTRAVSTEHRERLRGGVVLFGLHLVLIGLACTLRIAGSSLASEARVAGLMLATLSTIGVAGTFLFTGVLPRLRLRTPRILQDVLIAGSSIVGVFLLASHAGLNISGLIATSAVLTAVVGLAFQDTLGNIVGGLTLQLDSSLAAGDWIKVGDVTGKILEIRWRYTAVETRNWETVYLPNSALVKGQFTVLGRRQGAPLHLRRWVYFNVDFRYPPSEVTRAVLDALRGAIIERVATTPPPDCVLMDLHESYGRYAVRYYLTDIAVDDPTDGVVRTRIYFALRRAGIPLSIPAHAIFMTEDTAERKHEKSEAEVQRRLEALTRVHLFDMLSDEERQGLATHLRHAPFAAGEVMTRQGAEAHWLYMITDGVASVHVTVDGRDREVAQLGAGDFFGEMSLLTGAPRAATVFAETHVDCYRLDKAAFQELIERRPNIAENIADVLATRADELSAARVETAQGPVSRHSMSRGDILGKIRSFFALD